MDLNQARFNMIEQQIRPWEVLDPQVLELLMAAKVRLRPILMTTLAMIFGMVPLAFALSEGSEQRAPMGQAVIGGVITSTLLTLLVVPVLCMLLERRKQGRGPVTPVAALGSET